MSALLPCVASRTSDTSQTSRASRISDPGESRSAFSRFFAHVQDAPWYHEFLRPVVTTLADLPAGARVVDVGTGPGQLLALLRQALAVECVGVDTDRAMLDEARRRPGLADVLLLQSTAGQALPLPLHSVDAVCFCSVLYLLDAQEVEALLQQASQLLRPHGRIVILTPSGVVSAPDQSVSSTPLALPLRRQQRRQWQWTFQLWRRLTASAGREWRRQRLVSDFATQQGMRYASQLAFSGMALLEVVTAP